VLQPAHFMLQGPGVKRGGDSGGSDLKAGMTVAQAEKNLIIKTLEHCGQNRTQAAKLLGISVRTLRNKLNEYKR